MAFPVEVFFSKLIIYTGWGGLFVWLAFFESAWNSLGHYLPTNNGHFLQMLSKGHLFFNQLTFSVITV